LKTVTLLFRLSRPNENYSIESSFDQMAASFPENEGFRLQKAYAPYFSNGLFPRLKIIAWAARQTGDVFHITGDIHFIALGLPRRRTVLTVHDCGFLTHPHTAMRFLLWLFWLKLPVWWCAHVTAVSEATKADIIRHTGCPPEKIAVIPTVIKSLFCRVDKPFNGAKPLVLHIGCTPNKNLLRHIDALAGLPVALHVIGQLNAEQSNALRHSGLEYRNSTGLSDEAMLDAYAEADLVLFASTFEGFGMPILEAQTVGRPVVTSDCSSMPWVAGGGACLVDPFNVASIRAGLERVIGDAAYRSTLVETGFRNVARFGASAVGRAYARVYQLAGSV